jgi:putative ATP-dependent endonuclease of the OLD family
MHCERGGFVHISELRLRNFRNFHKARFRFEPGVNTLIGENGSGKTNALSAMRLLLDDSLSRRATSLSETDFCRAVDNWRGHWIVISLDFEDLDASEGCQQLRQEAAHMNGTNTGTHTLYFRPRIEVRKKLFEMTEDGREGAEFRDYLDGITIDDYEPVLTGRAEGDILDDAVYAALVGDLDDFSFPDPDNEDQALFGVRVSPVHTEVSCTFAPALRDVVSDLRGYRSNPLLTLLRGTETTIQIDDATRIVEAVEALNDDISSLDEIKAIAAGIQGRLHATVGYTYSPLVEIESGLPDELDKLFQRLNMKVGDGEDTDYRGEVSEQSLGGANLIYLALKLLEYELKLSSDRVAHFLLIEEPEAHIHTHIQKTLFEKQSLHKTQVIVSTHSTHISSVAKVRSVNVLARKRNHAEVYQPAAGLQPKEVQRLERYLDSVRSTLLFAKGIVLVEGSAELVLLPSLLKAVFGLSPDELGLSVISMDCAFFEHVAKVFHEARIRRRCAIVTDRDAPYIDLPEDAEDDDPRQAKARAANAVGERRCASLDEFCAGNDWIAPFTADYTFEVDFLLVGNAHEIGEVVDDVYAKPERAKFVKAALKDKDVSVSATAVMRLADRLGKGWFALLLAEKLLAGTYVPEYLLQAIAFAAAESLSDDVFKRMALYRIERGMVDDEANVAPIGELEKMPATNVIETFLDAADEDDDLSRLIAAVREARPE